MHVGLLSGYLFARLVGGFKEIHVLGVILRVSLGHFLTDCL